MVKKSKVKRGQKKNLILGGAITLIVIFAIVYLINQGIQQSAFGTPDICYKWQDGNCIEITTCDISGVTLHTTMDACIKAHPGGMGYYYRFKDNECTAIALSPSLKTPVDYNTMPECQSHIINPNKMSSVNWKPLAITGGIILLISLIVFGLNKKGKQEEKKVE